MTRTDGIRRSVQHGITNLADNQINAALIIGSGVQDWRGLDPAAAA